MNRWEDRVVSWAKARPDVRAILVVGSRARRDHPADEWSDLDLMIFSTDVDPYRSSEGWLPDMGETWASVPFQRMDGYPEHLVLLEGGRKVDFAFFPLGELQRWVEAQTLPEVCQRGYYILLDKEGMAAQLPPSPFAPPPYEKPSQDGFWLSVTEFWHDALQVAQYIQRRELWPVKAADYAMKENLLKMMEWHAQATHAGDCDTWHDGRFLSEWTDSQTLKELDNTFGRFNVADSWRALLATMALFRRLARETAARLGYRYDENLGKRVTRFVKRLCAEDDVFKT